MSEISEEQMESARRVVLEAMLKMRMDGPPITPAEETAEALETRRADAMAVVEKLIDVLGMRNAMPSGFSHKQIVKAFRRGREIGGGEGITRAEDCGKQYLVGVLMSVCGGHANPAEFNELLDRADL